MIIFNQILKKFQFKFLICAIVFAFGYSNTYAKDDVLKSGEELTYEVSFLGVKLGSIKIVTQGEEKIAGKRTQKTKATIDSYEGIPFVALHTIFESWVDPSVSYSHKFAATTKESDGVEREIINFDYKNSTFQISKWKNQKSIDTKTFSTKKKWNDGLTLYFFARKFIRANRTVKVPTVIGGDTSVTKFTFSGKKESVEIDAVSYPVRTVHFSGSADWSGVYGLSGNFVGWFSDDEAAVPIKAKMNVLVGSVNIQLVKWVRSGWAPPKAS